MHWKRCSVQMMIRGPIIHDWNSIALYGDGRRIVVAHPDSFGFYGRPGIGVYAAWSVLSLILTVMKYGKQPYT